MSPPRPTPAGPLVDARTLADLISAAAVTVLDVRWTLLGPSGTADFAAGHLPGATFVDLDHDLAAPPDERGRHPLPDPAAFSAAMRRAGVSLARPVVCYDASDGTSAARCWWLLRYFGHADVRVLDGGYAGWVLAGLPVTVDDALPTVGDFAADPGHLPLLDAVTAGRLARHGVLLDARAAERYRGESEPIDPVAGHIPGAVSAPTAGNVAADGSFLGSSALRSRFQSLGVSDEAAVGAYCGSGIVATHEVLALGVAGFEAALYADSWSGWITDPDRPVATGATPG